jgi:hypothetical protein
MKSVYRYLLSFFSLPYLILHPYFAVGAELTDLEKKWHVSTGSMTYNPTDGTFTFTFEHGPGNADTPKMYVVESVCVGTNGPYECATE